MVFDATSAEPATINLNVTVQGVTIAASYSGVVTQAAGAILTVTGGVADFIQAGGTFAGGNSAIAVSDQFTLSGGSFTSTTSTLTVNGAFTVSGGTFAHNGGTVRFSTSNATIDVPGSLTLNHVVFLSGTKTIAAGDTLDIVGTLNLAGGVVNTGILAAQGNINVLAGFTGNSTATLLINGAGDQTMTGNHAVGSGDLPAVAINKPGGSLTLGTSGTGILRTSDNWTFTAAPGGLVTTGSTVVFTGGTITGSHTLDSVQIRGGTVIIAAGTTLTAAGSLNLFSGVLDQAAATGTLAAQGNIDVQAGFTGNSTATLLINGASNQTVTGYHAVGSGDLPAVVIDKPGGAMTLGTSGTDPPHQRHLDVHRRPRRARHHRQHPRVHRRHDHRLAHPPQHRDPGWDGDHRGRHHPGRGRHPRPGQRRLNRRLPPAPWPPRATSSPGSVSPAAGRRPSSSTAPAPRC